MLKTEQVQQTLEQAGFDSIEVGEVTKARKEDGRVWEVVLDRGGQMRATITFRAHPPQEHPLPYADKKLLLMTEQRTVLTSFCTIDTPTELKSALDALDGYLAKAE